MVGEGLTIVVLWLLGRLCPWSTLVSLALWWGRSKVNFKSSRLIWLIGLGVVEDISRVDSIGIRPALLISLLIASWLIARYYPTRQLWWWLGLAVVGEIGMRLINHQGLSLVPIVGQVMFLGLWDWSTKRFGRQDAIYVQD